LMVHWLVEQALKLNHLQVLFDLRADFMLYIRVDAVI